MEIRSPRLFTNPLCVKHRDGIFELNSCNTLFGLLLFLEYGNWEFSEQILDEAINIEKKLLFYRNEERAISDVSTFNEINFNKCKLLKLYGCNDNWNANFLLLCFVEFNDASWEIYDLEILNNQKVNKYLDLLLNITNTNTEFLEDMYVIPKYTNFWDAVLKASTKTLFDVTQVSIKREILKKQKRRRSIDKIIQTKKKKINVKDLEIKTTFTFLKGTKEIKFEL